MTFAATVGVAVVHCHRATDSGEPVSCKEECYGFAVAMRLLGLATMAMPMIRTHREEQFRLARFGYTYRVYMEAALRNNPRLRLNKRAAVSRNISV